MVEHGFLFKGQMVRALRAVPPKTQTRRLPTSHNCVIDGMPTSPKRWAALAFDKPDEIWVDDGPSPAGNPGPYLKVPHRTDGTVHRVYPRVQVGDRIWVRETWQAVSGNDRARHIIEHPQPDRGWLEYSATPRFDEPAYKWRPAIHMPRWASRITLEVTRLRFQRLQDISARDVWAEGIEGAPPPDAGITHKDEFGYVWSDGERREHPRPAYRLLWNSINGEGSWETNPWVIVYEFNEVKS